MNLISLLLLVNIFLASGFKLSNTRNSLSKITMRKKITERSTSPYYKPRTNNQKKYVESIINNDIVLGIGPAGTGKTLFACTYAIQQLQRNEISKIILTRPIVTVEEDLGYLPGKLNSKMEPWTRPIFDIFLEYYDQRSLTGMLSSGQIEIAPLAYMRGRTFKNSVIIADEMQNSSPNQMMMITTRVGDNSKLLITGDLNQSDRYEDNGLKDLVYKINTYGKDAERIEICEFTEMDIQRSKIVETIIKIYNINNGRTKLPLPTIQQYKKRKEPKIVKEINNIKKEEKKVKRLEYERKANDDAAMITKREMTRLYRDKK